MKNTNRNEHSSKSMSGHVRDITGNRYGRLIVTSFNRRENSIAWWNCKCDCGKEVVVRAGNLSQGTCRSCGCYRNEMRAVGGKSNRRHGMTGTRIYLMWKNMRKRCNYTSDKDYKDYGGRGVRVCDEWNKFENFYEWAISNGYDDTLTIDRIDNNKGYSPDNCRFATAIQQVRNRRNTVFLEYNGEKKALTEWCDYFGLNKKTIYNRVHLYGWTNPKEILFGKGAM